MAAPPELVEFRLDDADAVVVLMVDLATSRQGWINFVPEVDPDDVPRPRSLLSMIFGASGPEVPLATWKAGEERRRRVEPPSIGIQHASGPKAAARLAERGHPLPDGWVVLQDHPKRGLVVAVPPEIEAADVLRWLLGATAALSTVPLGGHWQAAVYRGIG